MTSVKQFICISAIATSLIAGTSEGAGAGEFLTSDQIRDQVIGREYSGSGFSEEYMEDGKLRSVWGSKIVRGTWSINDDDELCVQYNNASSYNGCWKIRAGSMDGRIVYIRGSAKINGKLVE